MWPVRASATALVTLALTQLPMRHRRTAAACLDSAADGPRALAAQSSGARRAQDEDLDRVINYSERIRFSKLGMQARPKRTHPARSSGGNQ